MGAVPAFIPRSSPLAGPVDPGAAGTVLVSLGDGTTRWEETDPAGSGTGIDHTWAFGDAPQVVYTATQGQRLVAVVLSIRAPLNGVAPLIRLGKTGSGSPPADVLAGGDTDPQSAGVYEVNLDYPLAAGERLTFTITPDGSTAGAGVLTLYFV